MEFLLSLKLIITNLYLKKNNEILIIPHLINLILIFYLVLVKAINLIKMLPIVKIKVSFVLFLL